MNLSIIVPSKNEPKIGSFVFEIEHYFPNAQIIICNDRYGNGKGWAVRMALAEATGDVICFIDGDGDINPSMINRLLPFLPSYDIIVGRKIIRGKLIRKLVTFWARIYVRIFFGLNFETQCGLKVFKKEAIPEWKDDGFMFDLEVLTKAKDAGFKIVEVPVEVTPYGATSKSIRTKNVFRCFLASLRILLDRIF